MYSTNLKSIYTFHVENKEIKDKLLKTKYKF